jgi:hypothetical protein
MPKHCPQIMEEIQMKTVALVLALAAGAMSAHAGTLTFTMLCDAGVSNCTTETPITTVGVPDSHFTLSVVPAGVTSPTVDTYFYPTYYQSGTNPIGTDTASWITTDSAGAPTQAVGTFNYQQVITTTSFAGTFPVTLSGSWGTDNCGTIAWGATPAPVTGGTGTTISGGVGDCMTSGFAFGTLTPFNFTEDVTGNTTYYLDFEVGNTGYVTGLLVDDLSASSVTTTIPEPSSLLLIASGLAVCALFSRRLQWHSRVRDAASTRCHLE